MLERVEATLKEAARSRDGKTISLRLDPAQLGRVKVDVSLREGALHARITPENRQVLASLREHAHELQGALRKLGLNVDSVTVTVTSDGGQEMSDFGKELNHGKSFQQDRNNMPDEAQQVPEKTIGSELAEGSTVGSPQKDVTVEDHWVA
jgi:flagellar hook-length control protein FliK